MVVAALVLVGCAGTKGLGKGACPYVRPRLIRLDTDRLHLPSSLPDITAVSEDFAGYVRTNLPSGGRARSDRRLVQFSAALSGYVHDAGRDPTPLTAAERGLDSECHIAGY